ncbi:MAG: alpha/beta hydrolase [Colwellia sp.]|nr:alpha/beta hydrolase [Colwellia sp.]
MPKSFDKSKQFVFLHGFKVDETGARAWHAEMFKRLFQSGSNAMYIGFSWDSDEGLISDGAMNYWGNVENALNSAPIVSNIINNSLTGDITIAAHSLGNMVLGQAIQQYGLTPNHYFMLNPAVPTEAYNASQLAETGDPKKNLMTIPDWS